MTELTCCECMRIHPKTLIIALIICVSLCVPVFAEASFSDVTEETWYTDGVSYVYEHGLMNGKGSDRFAPFDEASRAMLVTILYRIEGEPSVDPLPAAGFTDVPAGSYYAKAVRWAAANGIVNGKGNGRFAPVESLTREQLAALLYRYTVYKGGSVDKTGDLSAFTDHASVSNYAKTAMAWAVGCGFIGGSNGKLDPGKNANRAQLAVILQRYCESNAVFENINENGEPNDGSSGSPATGSNDPYDSSVVDLSEPNVFKVSGVLSPDRKTVDLNVTLCGKVKLCAFDMTLKWDPEVFTLNKLEPSNTLQIFASTKTPGSLPFNYSGTADITAECTLFNVTFDVTGTIAPGSAFSINAKEVIACGADLDLVPAEYTLTYCQIK